MLFIYAFLIAQFGIWTYRAVTMLSSMKRYNIMPEKSWSDDPAKAPKVSFIIPCKNEAANLPRLLPTLDAQNYPNLEIILINDRSDDNTGELLEAYGKDRDHVTILHGKPKPDEWTGKAHALHQAVAAASGDWFLFSDADTQHSPQSVSSSLKHAMDRKTDFLTLTSEYLCESFAEYLIQPMAIGCFAVWFKLQDVNDPKSQVPLACGHFILINREAYNRLGGFEAIKGEVLEDLALFKQAKKRNDVTFELAIGSHVFKTRMYDSFRACWRGWRRIFMHSLDRKLSIFAKKIAALFFNSFVPTMLPLILIPLAAKDAAWQNAATLSFALLIFILFLRAKSHQAIKAPFWPVLFHPVSALIMIGILIDCAAHLIGDKKVAWKGDKY